jgi:hypothetical protein
LPDFGHELEPFERAGLRTVVAPGTSSWSVLFPDLPSAYTNIGNFVRDGHARGAIGAIVTTWDDDGDSLFDPCWPALVFGAACAWRGGEPDLAGFEAAYDWVFHRHDGREVTAALRDLGGVYAILRPHGRGLANDNFWLDPFTREGARLRDQIRAVVAEVRLAAERALESLLRLRGRLRVRGEALAAVELAARRIDLLGLKLQLADEISEAYAAALAADEPAAIASALKEISDIDGRLQDLRDGYAELRALHEAAWARENRPGYLGSILARYDVMTASFQSRIQAVARARWQLRFDGTLPSAAEVGIWLEPDPAG